MSSHLSVSIHMTEHGAQHVCISSFIFIVLSYVDYTAFNMHLSISATRTARRETYSLRAAVIYKCLLFNAFCSDRRDRLSRLSA